MMRGVNDKNFLNLWQILHRATCPDLERFIWQVGEVEWRKERHSFSGAAYSVSHGVHLLRHEGGGWLLMVVIECWWDQRREVLKSTCWARMVKGPAQAAIAWLRKEHRGLAL